MLDGEDFRRAVLERSCAHGIGDILALRSDCRRARKIASPEQDARAGFGRMHGHGHRQPGVQAIAFISDRFLDGVLFSIHDEYLSRERKITARSRRGSRETLPACGQNDECPGI